MSRDRGLRGGRSGAWRGPLHGGDIGRGKPLAGDGYLHGCAWRGGSWRGRNERVLRVGGSAEKEGN
jgi:hypothetical protein